MQEHGRVVAHENILFHKDTTDVFVTRMFFCILLFENNDYSTVLLVKHRKKQAVFRWYRHFRQMDFVLT